MPNKLPERVLGCLRLLLKHLQENPEQKAFQLNSGEAALLIVTPFVREAVLAQGVRTMAAHNPLNLEETGQSTGPRGALEKIHRGLAMLLRKAQRLRETGKAKDADHVSLWLMHRCLLREVWQWEDCKIEELTGQAEQPELLGNTLDSARLMELTRCLFANPERLEREDRPGALQPCVSVSNADYDELTLRETLLGWLLMVAGGMAFDPRLLPEVLADHLGLSDTPALDALVPEINAGRWEPDGMGRKFSVQCSHPALDVSLRDAVEHVNHLLEHAQRAAERHTQQTLLRHLPARLTPDSIIAKRENRRPLYQTPHLRFRLSQQQVLELLMGEQLYGDPTLAIRELYQNALDACRYAQARLQYLKKTGRNTALDAWEGRIQFRQGTDEEGRAYIECEDNGIGMGMRELQECFAVAGHRFAETPEFLEEQAEWEPYEIKLYPNSQFGIGVLSYFMLADEFIVDTCRMGRDGRPDEPLRVSINGSGSLFRIQPGGRNTWGTRIRLYLNKMTYKKEDKEVPVSCVETLKHLLWIAEFPTEVTDFKETVVWQPKRLGHEGRADRNLYLATDCPDFYWSKRNNYKGIEPIGILLADGIYTETEGLAWQVINLQGQQYPTLSINRKNVHKWDKNRAAQQANEHWLPIAFWQETDLAWLTNLSIKYIQLINHVWEVLAEKHDQLPVSSGAVSLEDTDSRFLVLAPGQKKNLVEKLRELKITISFNGFIPQDFVFIMEVVYNSVTNHIIHIKKLIDIAFNVYPVSLAVQRLVNIYRACIGLPFSASIHGLARLPARYLLPMDAWLLSKRMEVKLFESYSISWLDTPEWLDTTEQVPLPHIARAAEKLQKSIAEVSARLQQLGFTTPVIDLDKIGKITKQDRMLLSEDLDARAESSWLDAAAQVPLGHIFRTAEQLKISVTEVSARLQQLGFTTPVIDLDKIGKNTKQDTMLLSKDLVARGEPSYLDTWLDADEQVPLGHIFRAAEKLQTPVAEVSMRLQQLGFTTPVIDPDIIGEITQQDSALLSKDLDAKPPWLDAAEQVPLGHIFRAAEKLQKPVAEVRARLQQLGFTTPVIDLDKIGEITQQDSALLSRGLDAELPWLDAAEQVPLGHIFQAAEKLKTPVAEVSARLRQLSFTIPVIDLDKIGKITEQDRVLLSRNLNAKSLWLDAAERVPLAHILHAAGKLQKPVAEVSARLQNLGFTMPVTDLDKIGEITGQERVLLIKDLNEHRLDRYDFKETLDEAKLISPDHILKAAEKFQRPADEIAKRLEEFGYTVIPKASAYSKLSEDELVLVRYIFPKELEKIPEASKIINKPAIQLAQVLFDLSVEDAEQYLRDFLERILPDESAGVNKALAGG